jgi:hypothetical protein
MLQLFGYDIFPQHVNQALFDPIPGFVAVGVGPLNYDSKFVEIGPPDPKLIGNMLFLALRMKLRGPPLHIAHPREMYLFNEFLKEHPKPSAKNWEDLAKLFLEKSDYLTIFPKLPSMLRNYYNKWKVTQELVMIKDSIKTDYYDLLKKFVQPSSEIKSAAAEFQKNASDRQLLEPIEDLGETVTQTVFDTAPPNPMPLPPLVAPAQSEYVVSGDGRGKHLRRCSAAAFGCPRLAKDCSRKGWDKCTLVKRKSTSVNVPESEDERNSVIENYERERTRERMNRLRNIEKQREEDS